MNFQWLENAVSIIGCMPFHRLNRSLLRPVRKQAHDNDVAHVNENEDDTKMHRGCVLDIGYIDSPLPEIQFLWPPE